MTAPNGVISSPNYPASYDDNNDCAWKIQASEGQQIKVHKTGHIHHLYHYYHYHNI